MLKNVFLAIVVSLLFSCSYDYELEPSQLTEPDRLVVSSLLNPQEPLTVYFHITCKTDTGYWFQPVRNVHVLLKEDGQVIYDAICPDTVLQLDNPVKAGANYAIEVRADGYQDVSANTTVPQAIRCHATDEGHADPQSAWYDYLVKLSGFELPGNESSLWITAYRLYDNGDVIQYNEIYTNHLLLDRINQITGMEVLNPVVGSLYHDAFLRIKNKDLPYLQELIFTPTMTIHYGSYIPDADMNGVQIKVTTAGREYDQYCRTLYQQKSMIIYDDDISAIVYQPISVYSNIKNGLGIFAGINEVNFYFDITANEAPF